MFLLLPPSATLIHLQGLGGSPTGFLLRTQSCFLCVLASGEILALTQFCSLSHLCRRPLCIWLCWTADQGASLHCPSWKDTCFSFVNEELPKLTVWPQKADSERKGACSWSDSSSAIAALLRQAGSQQRPRWDLPCGLPPQESVPSRHRLLHVRLRKV